MSNAKVIELHPKNPLCPCCPHPMGQHWSEEGVCQAKDCMCILADDITERVRRTIQAISS